MALARLMDIFKSWRNGAWDRAYSTFAIATFVIANLAVGGLLAGIAYKNNALYESTALREGANLLESFDKSLTTLLDRQYIAQNILAAEYERAMNQGAVDPAHLKRTIGLLSADVAGEGPVFPLFVFDSEGNLVASTLMGNGPGHSVARKEYFMAMKNDAKVQRYFTPIVYGNNSGQYGIISARRVNRPDGSFGGVVTSQMTGTAAASLFKSVQLADDDMLYVGDSRDFVILARVPGLSSRLPFGHQTKSPAPGEIVDLIAKGAKSGHAVTSDTIDHRKRTVAFKIQPDAPLLVIVGIGQESHFAPWRAQVLTSIGVFACFALFSSAALYAALRYKSLSAKAILEAQSIHEDLHRQFQRRTEELDDATKVAREAQASMLENERLASLGAMSAGVAHELNTPLGNSLLSASSIVDAARGLQADLADPSKQIRKSDLTVKLDKIAALADMQAQSIGRAADLVRSFKQLAVDQASGRRRVFDLRDTLAGLVASFQPAMSRASAKLFIDMDVPESLACDSYPGALCQIATNMIQNAMRHAFEDREEGIIHIAARAFVDAGGMARARVSFSDDGVGMRPEIHARAFERFVTTKAASGGSGVGLSLSKGLAKMCLVDRSR